MKFRFVLFALFLTLASASFASRTSDVTVALTHEYQKYVKAFTVKDMSVIERQLLPEFTAHMQGRVLNRKQLLDMTAETIDETRSVKDMCIKIKRVTVKGNVATAVVTDTASLNMGAPGEEPHLVLSSDLRRDTWVRTASGWKLKRIEVLKSYG